MADNDASVRRLQAEVRDAIAAADAQVRVIGELEIGMWSERIAPAELGRPADPVCRTADAIVDELQSLVRRLAPPLQNLRDASIGLGLAVAGLAACFSPLFWLGRRPPPLASLGPPRTSGA